MSYHNCDLRVVETTTLCFCVAAIFLVTEMMHVTLETINRGAGGQRGGQGGNLSHGLGLKGAPKLF